MRIVLTYLRGKTAVWLTPEKDCLRVKVFTTGVRGKAKAPIEQTLEWKQVLIALKAPIPPTGKHPWTAIVLTTAHE